MKIYSVTMHNFMLYPKFHRIFGDKDVVGIIAEYKNEALRSNRGGKTTILEGIRYCLNGTSRAPRDVDLIHNGASEMWVEVVLIEGKEKHRIVRGRDIKNHGMLEVDGITKTDEAQKRIDELIGFDARDFELTCFFKQQDIHQFMEMKPREKQKHLMQWLNNHHWLKLERSALDDLAGLNRQLIELKSKLELLQQQVVSDEDLKTELRMFKIGLQESIAEREALTANLSKLQKSVLSDSDRNDVRKKLMSVNGRIDQVQSEYDDLQEVREQLNEVKAIIAGFDKTKTVSAEKEKGIVGKLRRFDAELTKVRDLIATAQEDFTGVCPILKQACDRITYDKKMVALWEGQAEALEARCVKLQDHLDRIEAHKEAAARFHAAYQRHQPLLAQVQSGTRLKADLDRLRAEKKVLQDQLVAGKTADVSGQILGIKQQIVQLDEKIAKFNSKIGGVRERRKRVVQLKNQLDTITETIRKKQLRINVQKYVAYMFGRNGIPAQEIESGFAEIEDETNFVLQRFGTNLSIMFDPDRELKAWEPACLACGWVYPKGGKSKACLECGTDRQKKKKDELTVKVIDNGEERDFALESGGGKTLVSFSNRLALTRLKQRKSQSNFNVLFLDEPDSALDQPNKRAFVDLITTTLIKKFGIEQIFWVSHDRNICESIPNVLKVTRFEKHSTTGWLS